jgi:hypothetical protein
MTFMLFSISQVSAEQLYWDAAAEPPQILDDEGIYRDYALTEADPAACERFCEEDQECIAWSYTPPTHAFPRPRCLLYNNSYPSALFPISGIKEQYRTLPEYSTLEEYQEADLYYEQLAPAQEIMMSQMAPIREQNHPGQRVMMQQSFMRPAAHVWEYLHALGTEPEGYATYSYIVTGRHGSEKYLDLVKLIQRSTAGASEMVDILLPEELNIFLIPAINTGSETGIKPDLRFSQQVLTVLSARSPLDFNRPGPYIITLYHPIGKYSRRDQVVDMLYVDLTNVHSGAVAEVVRTYKQTVLKKELRGQEKLRSLRLSLLKLAFLAEDSIGFARTAAASLDTLQE